jgi:predicted HNH restriction endonuclease
MPLLSQAWLNHELLAYLTSRIAIADEEACTHLARLAGVEPGDSGFRQRVLDTCRTLLDDGLVEQRDGRWRIIRLRDAADLPEELPPSSAAHYSESASVNVRTNKYERDRNARRQCIDHYGARCQACGFDFEAVYGALGRGCVRVHHLVPPAQLGSAYRLDPVRDLRPVCANCHYMLHRTDPPGSVEQLRQLLQRQQARAQSQASPAGEAAVCRS